MSNYDSTTNSSFARGGRQPHTTVARRELAVQLDLKELEIVCLRRRLARLEEIHGLDPDGRTQKIRSLENELEEELDSIRERSDE